MDQPELSLGPNLCKKRKLHFNWDDDDDDKPMSTQASIELQLNDPLPMDWEQCLDLQSGRMYYLNRKTLKRSWARPKETKIDLELNMSTIPNTTTTTTTTTTHEKYPRKYTNSSGSMVAVACNNCHLLVMLSKSSPSCPNCKHVHSLVLSPPREIEPVKSLETLSLMH